MATRDILEFIGVSWEVDGRQILSGINWRVRAGEHWLILGLNGSGKTSLIKMLSAYNSPSSGTLKVMGETYGTYDWREMRKRIGFVSSSITDDLYKTETALEIVLGGLFGSIGLWDNVTEKQRELSISALDRLGAKHLADEPYANMSQGERQRTLIARAMVSRPGILVLDEPCEGLDIMARESLLENLSALASKKDCPTLLYVTHRTEELLPLFSHALLLRGGEIFGKGRVRDIISSHVLTGFFGRSTDVTWKNGRPWVTL